MTVIDSFMKKRIEQLLKEYGSPEQVIDLLRETLPFGDQQAIDSLESYIYHMWRSSSSSAHQMDIFSLPDISSDIHPLAAESELLDKLGLQKYSNGSPGMPGEQDISRALEFIENEFQDILLEEEIRTLDRMNDVQIDFSGFESELTNLPIITDIIALIHYLFDEKPPLAWKKDGELKKASLKRLTQELEGRLPSLASIPDKINYVRFICNLAYEAFLFERNDAETGVVPGQHTGVLLKGDMTNAQLYYHLFRAFWLRMRDSALEGKKVTYTDPEELYFKIAPVLLATAAMPAAVEDVYLPAFVGILVEEQTYSAQRTGEIKNELVRGIEELHNLYFQPMYAMGILEKQRQDGSSDTVRLTPWGLHGLGRLQGSYTPLLQTEVFLSAASGLVTSYLLLYSLFADLVEGLEAEHLQELQQLATEVDIALDSFFMFVAGPDLDNESIIQVREVSRFILEKVLSAIVTFRDTRECNKGIHRYFQKRLKCD